MITHKAYLYDKYLKNSISVIKFIISLNDKRYIKLIATPVVKLRIIEFFTQDKNIFSDLFPTE